MCNPTKKVVTLLSGRLPLILLIALFTLFYSMPQLLAQDPAVVEIIEPAPVILVNQSTPITAVIENQGGIEAENVSVQIEVLDLGLDQVFFLGHPYSVDYSR